MNGQRFFLHTSLISAMLCGALVVHGADQAFDPRLEIGGTYDSNLRLAAAPLNDKVTGGYVDALADWTTRTPLTDFRLTPRLRATRYSGNGETGTTNFYLNGDLNHHLERSRLGLAFNISKQEVLTSELLDANGSNGLGTPGTGTAGLAFTNSKALFAVVRPTGRFDLGKRTQLLIDTQYTRVDYDRARALIQNDYSDVAGTIGFSFQATPRVRWVTNLTADKFTPRAGTADARNVGANVELWREQSELVRAFIRVGAVRSQFSGSGSAASETSANGGVGVQRDFATGHLFLQANRTVDASGSGQLLLRDELNLRLGRKLTERVLITGGAAAIWTEPVAKNSALGKRRYYVASLGGEWRVRRTVSLEARYEYSSVHFQSAAGTPDSNAAYAGVVFEPHRRN